MSLNKKSKVIELRPGKTGKSEFYKKGSKRLSAEELAGLSNIVLHNEMTPKEKLAALSEMIVDVLPVAHGLFRKSPGSSTAYALNALMTKMQEIQEQVATGLDLGSIAIEAMDEIVQPGLEDITLQLGKQLRAEMRELVQDVDSKTAKKIKRAVDSTFRKFGAIVRDKNSEMRSELENHFNKIK